MLSQRAGPTDGRRDADCSAVDSLMIDGLPGTGDSDAGPRLAPWSRMQCRALGCCCCWLTDSGSSAGDLKQLWGTEPLVDEVCRMIADS